MVVAHSMSNRIHPADLLRLREVGRALSAVYPGLVALAEASFTSAAQTLLANPGSAAEGR